MTPEELKEWYQQNRDKYQKLTEKAEAVLKELFEIKKIDIQNIHGRTKTVKSFGEKVLRKKISKKSSIHDMSGVRAVFYLLSDSEKAITLVENEFDVDRENTIDKSVGLQDDKMGYRSVHYVVSFRKERILLPEFSLFSGMKFEIQFSTVLQHAWAEIEHDRGYKYQGQLDEKVKRRLNLVAALLEIADNEFDDLTKIVGDSGSISTRDSKDFVITLPRGIAKDKMRSLREFLVRNPGFDTGYVVIPSSDGDRIDMSFKLSYQVNYTEDVKQKVAEILK